MDENVQNNSGEEEMKDLLSEFKASTYDDWVEAAEKSLKGKPLSVLFGKRYDGIEIKPIYNPKDVENIQSALPGFFPFDRGYRADGYKGGIWETAQEFPYPNPEDFNSALKNDLEKGLNAIHLTLDYASSHGIDPDSSDENEIGFGGTSIYSTDCLGKAFDGIDVTCYPVYIHSRSALSEIYSIFSAYLDSARVKKANVSGGIFADGFAALEQEGYLSYSTDKYFDQLASVIKHSNINYPNFKLIYLEAGNYLEAGANTVQEISFLLSKLVFVINELQARDLNINLIAKNIMLGFSISPDFFGEIAKFKAVRMLVAKILKEYGAREENQKVKIFARTCSWNKSGLDPHVNMLRSTSEAFSAILGSVDSICVEPFDNFRGLPTEFSRRVARNTQLVLAEECNVREVADPAGGAWYIESLKNELVEKSWEMFQTIENGDGYLPCLMEEKLIKMVNVIKEQKLNDFQTRKNVLLGTNKYPNLYEKEVNTFVFDFEKFAAKQIDSLEKRNSNKNKEVLYDLLKTIKDEGTIESAVEAAKLGATIGELRTAIVSETEEIELENAFDEFAVCQLFEELRENALNYKSEQGEFPKVYMANIGKVRDYKARADFSQDFFSVGGFESIISEGSETMEEAAKKAIESNCDAIVICSTDDIYTEVVPGLTRLIKKVKPLAKVVLAGYPKDKIEEYKAAGVDEFIHVKANVYEINMNLQIELGVKKNSND
jgi:methylmalonyl-CoA mutase